MDDRYQPDAQVQYIRKQPVWVFCLLSFFTFGLYTMYWLYRNWCFFRDAYEWDIYPFWRAVFNVFFVHTLLEHINDLAVEKGHPGISSNGYATGYVIFEILQRVLNRTMPDYVVLIYLLLLPFVWLVPTVKQLNYIYEQANPDTYHPPFTPHELVALMLGGLVIALAVLGLLTT